MTQGLQIFEKMQRHEEEIEFLRGQRNFLAATDELRLLQKELEDPDTREMLQECDLLQTWKLRLRELRENLEIDIISNITDFVYHKRTNSMVQDRLMLIYDLVSSKLGHKTSLAIFTQKI